MKTYIVSFNEKKCIEIKAENEKEAEEIVLEGEFQELIKWLR